MKRNWSTATWIIVLVAAAFLQATTVHAASNIQFRDNAHLFSAQDRRNLDAAARRAPFRLLILTEKGGYANNKPGFVRRVNNLPGHNGVVLAIDIGDHWFHVVTRRATGLTAYEMDAAKGAGRPYFTRRQWADGMIAALQTLIEVTAGH